MNKKLGLALLVISVLTSCRKNMVEITGVLEFPVPGKYVFFDELKSDKLISVDSVMLSEDGRFEIKRKVKYPSFFLLKINENNFLTMLLGPGEKIKFTSHYDSLNYPVVLRGSKGTELLVEYNHHLRKAVNNLKGLNDIFSENKGTRSRAALIDSLDNLAQDYLNEINSYTKKFIDDNINSLVSLVALYQQVAPNVYVLDPERDIVYFSKVDSSLYSQYPEYEPVITLHKQVQKMVEILAEKSTGLQAAEGGGIIAPEISLPSPEGDTIKLSSTRGSVVLLDFWASWCSPCRVENPNLVRAYNQFRGKGFQIYQVSLDKSKEAWINSIRDDGLEKWIHVSDVKYWNSVVVPLYKIESIPANFLLDREGRVIASNLRGESLIKTLARVFSEP